MIRSLLVVGLLWSCGPDETISGYTDPDTIWTLTEVDGVPYSAEAWLRFPTEGVVQGAGPCNSLTGRQAAPLPWIEITSLAVTRRACPALADEQRFLTGLQAATLAEPGPNILLLTNDDGLEMVFEAGPASENPT
ncbi:MAG: META domain-containing protein [Pseudomonadota bacterium]